MEKSPKAIKLCQNDTRDIWKPNEGNWIFYYVFSYK